LKGNQLNLKGYKSQPTPSKQETRIKRVDRVSMAEGLCYSINLIPKGEGRNNSIRQVIRRNSRPIIKFATSRIKN